jgi:hypothetical protein
LSVQPVAVDNLEQAPRGSAATEGVVAWLISVLLGVGSVGLFCCLLAGLIRAFCAERSAQGASPMHQHRLVMMGLAIVAIRRVADRTRPQGSWVPADSDHAIIGAQGRCGSAVIAG